MPKFTLTTELSALKKAVKFFGSQTALAKALSVPQAQISIWVKRECRMGASNKILKLEHLTNGLVTRYELRPDIYGKAPSKPTISSTLKQLKQLLKTQLNKNLNQPKNKLKQVGQYLSKINQQNKLKLIGLTQTIKQIFNTSSKQFKTPVVIMLSFVFVLVSGVSLGINQTRIITQFSNKTTGFGHSNEPNNQNNMPNSFNTLLVSEYQEQNYCTGLKCSKVVTNIQD